MTPVLLTVPEAAERARCHPQTVRGWYRSGELPYMQHRPLGRIYIWERDLLAFLGLPEGETAGADTGSHARD